MIIMSVDLGKARTGVAVSDKNEGFAFPNTVITEYNEERLIDKLWEKAQELKAELIVVGYPKNMDGSEGFRAKECAETAEKLKKKSGIDIVLWDERCTTVSAHNALNLTDTRGKKRKQSVDAVAAVIILEDYLNFRKNQKSDS
ncbi:MAG: Holliday junction resolvase RuvX [Clostridia bacterium]|nr:Holliday junction resolvase RuvX [Clostridia bacterium]